MKFDHCILRQIKLRTEFIHDLRWVFTIIHSDLFNILSIKLNLQHTYWRSSTSLVLVEVWRLLHGDLVPDRMARLRLLGRRVLCQVPLVHGLSVVVGHEVRLGWHQIGGRRQIIGHHVVVGRGAKRIIDHTVRLDWLTTVELGLLVVSLGLRVALEELVGDSIAIALVQILLVIRSWSLDSWQGPALRLN